MLDDLLRVIPTRLLCEVLGVPARVLEGWVAGSYAPTSAGVRVVWLTWVLLLHPDRLQTLGDIITWGRFRITRRTLPAGEVKDWSGWQI